MDWAISNLGNIERTWVVTHILCPGLVLVSLYRYFNDPLRSVPGPFLAKFTGAWVLFLDLSGKRSTTIHELHKKYGHVVRVGPKQLCFASPRALKDIYGANSKYPKAPIYEALGFKSVFTTRNRDDYRVMKKRILPSFSPAAVAEIEPFVHRQVENLIKCLDKRVDEPLDILPWFRMLALGVVGEKHASSIIQPREGFAADSFGGLENEKTPELLHHIDEVFPALWFWWMFPTLSTILQYSPFKPVRNFLRAAEDFKKDDIGVIEELTNLVFAGTDTTGNTLTYLFWELSHHPEWQARLHEELKEAVGDQTSYEYEAISKLPLLDAVVQEILRLRPAAPSGLQRLSSENGGVIDGIAVPPNVIISCQALSSQRDPTIFPEPDRFNPQRWIDGGESGTLELMREQIIVFGKGARACLGRNIAIMEIKCATAAMARRYKVEIGSPTTDDDMEMMDFTVLIPKGQKCVLRLTRV
ncbi:cytochrome P450 [Thozetella sp. PMI_491]|nr:cytochrome P450 [Thozetella sp. PMI_491]